MKNDIFHSKLLRLVPRQFRMLRRGVACPISLSCQLTHIGLLRFDFVHQSLELLFQPLFLRGMRLLHPLGTRIGSRPSRSSAAEQRFCFRNRSH